LLDLVKRREKYNNRARAWRQPSATFLYWAYHPVITGPLHTEPIQYAIGPSVWSLDPGRSQAAAPGPMLARCGNTTSPGDFAMTLSLPALNLTVSRGASVFVVLACAGLDTAPQRPAHDLRSGYLLVANQQSANVSLIDLRTDSMRFIPVPPGPHEAVIAPSGAVGVVTIYGGQGVMGNQLVVVDLRTGAISRTISLGEYTRPHGAVFLPSDETRVVVTSESTQRLVLVNLATGSVEHAIATQAGGSHMVAITADGKRAFTANVGSGSVSEIDLVAKNLVRVIPVAPQAEGIAVAPDGSTVWAGSNANGTVSVIDTRTGAIVETLTGFRLPYRLAISTDGRTAIICDPQGDRIHVADVAQRKVIWTLDALGSPRGVNIAPDGKTAFVTLAADQTVGVIDLENRRLTRRVRVGASPDGVWYGPVPR
jgi:YVTN family beta-propeller protein